MPELLKDVLVIVQTLLSIAACVLAILIPQKIKWEQKYSQLLCDYYSYDVGAAVMGIVLFFHDDCKNNIDLIPIKYKAIFKKQFKMRRPEGDTSQNYFTVPNEKNLHLQRRLLAQFYIQLDLCARSIFIGKKRVQKDFTSKEANLLKILYYMNEVASTEPIFKDISTDERIKNDKKGMNFYISDIYSILKNSPEYIRQ